MLYLTQQWGLKGVVEVIREVDDPDVVLADRFLPKLFSMLFLSSTSSTSTNNNNGSSPSNGRNLPTCSPSPSRATAGSTTNGGNSKNSSGINNVNNNSAPTITPVSSRPNLLAQRQAPSPAVVATLQCLAMLASEPAWLSDDAISQRLLPKVLALNLQDPDLFCALIGKICLLLT